MKKIIDFRRERNFDQIIEHSFKIFIKHIKPMMRIFWHNNVIPIIGFAISYFLYYYFYFGMFSDITKFGNVNNNNVFSQEFGMKMIVVIVAMIIFSVWIFPRFLGTVLGYIRVYYENEGEVQEEKVQKYVVEKFWGFIGLSLVVFLLLVFIGVIAGLLFFVIGKSVGVFILILLLTPFVFYLIVFMSLVYQAYFFDDLSIGNAISTTIKYINHKFWFSFAVIFVISLLVGIMGAIFNAPLTIYIIVKTIMMAEKQDIASVSQSGDIIISFISVLSLFAQYILKVITLIASSLLYFKLKEFHTHENSFKKIDSIGKKDDDTVL